MQDSTSMETQLRLSKRPSTEEDVSTRVLKKLCVRAKSNTPTHKKTLARPGLEHEDKPSAKRSKQTEAEEEFKAIEESQIFDRGVSAGVDFILELIPAALLEVERETRAQCTKEAEEDARAWARRRVFTDFSSPYPSYAQLVPSVYFI